jgi:DNA-binding XRE family transcriptional regulator
MRHGTVVNPNWTFKDWRMEARYTREDCCRLFDVSLRTVKDWDAGKRKPPKAVFLCLQIFCGRLDFLGKKWRGFRILPDCIEADNGQHIWHHEIYALPYLYGAVGMQRQNMLNMMKQKEDSRPNQETERPKGFIPIIVK